jgi:hypothetical protein
MLTAMGLSLLGSNQSLRVTSIVALAFATSVGVACADDPADPSGSGASGGSAGSSGGKGGSAGASNTGGSAGKGGTSNGGTSGGTAGTSNGGTAGTSGGTAGSGGTGGDPGAGGLPGAGGMPDGAGGMPDGAGGMPDGAGGMPDGAGGMPDGAGGMPDGAGGMPDGAGGMPDGAGGMGGMGGEGPVDPPLPINLLTGTPDPVDFEVNTNGWYTFGGTLALTEEFAHTGLKSGFVTKRTANYMGPATNITAHFTAGKTYKATAWAALDPDSAGAQDLKLSAKFDGCTTLPATRYMTIGQSLAAENAAGEWVELTGNFTNPVDCADATKVEMYVEGPLGQGDPVEPATDPVTYYRISFAIDDVSLVDVTP